MSNFINLIRERDIQMARREHLQGKLDALKRNTNYTLEQIRVTEHILEQQYGVPKDMIREFKDYVEQLSEDKANYAKTLQQKILGD